MNANEILTSILDKAEGKSSFFPPLDGDGISLSSVGSEALITLWADPDDTESLFFNLSMPLLSLSGASESIQASFLWELLKDLAPGALPPGYLIFNGDEDFSIYLGGQFSALGLELATLENLTDQFYRLGQVLREEFSGRLEALVAAAPETVLPAEDLELPIREEFIRV
ncbi:MAG: hypothetical protein LBE80_10155 [Deltaproteobacteria bacterium]|jgi:hypothetical protein|nr:hypothetical protein [Deltaproteobacteria bacterium]